MTRVTGSATIGCGSPTASCSKSAPPGALTAAFAVPRTGSGIGFPHGVTAELVAQCGQQTLREGIVLARAVAREERRRHRWEWDAPLYRFVQRPPSFSRVLHI